MLTGSEDIAIQNCACMCTCVRVRAHAASCVCAYEHNAYLCIDGRRRMLVILLYYSSPYFEKGLSLTPGVRLAVLMTPPPPQYWGYRHASDHTQFFT